MSNFIDSKSYGGTPEVQAEGAFSQVEHAYNLDEKAHVADYKADAIEAENLEHNMGVLEAVQRTLWLPFGRLSCPSLL